MIGDCSQNLKCHIKLEENLFNAKFSNETEKGTKYKI